MSPQEAGMVRAMSASFSDGFKVAQRGLIGRAYCGGAHAARPQLRLYAGFAVGARLSRLA